MSFSSVSNSEKKTAIQGALVDLNRTLYKLVSQLGVDPDAWNKNAFSFDPSSSDEVDPEFHIKKQIDATLAKMATLEAKIEQLS